MLVDGACAHLVGRMSLSFMLILRSSRMYICRMIDRLSELCDVCALITASIENAHQNRMRRIYAIASGYAVETGY